MKASERQKLKQDKYADTVLQSWQWAGKHTLPIVLGAAGLVVIGVVVAWVFYSRQHAEQTAGGKLTEIDARAQAAVAAKGDAQADAVKAVVAEFEGVAATYPDTQAAPIARLKAGKLLSMVGQKDAAVKQFQKALDLAGGRPGLEDIARRNLAEAYEDSGKIKEALANYEMLARDPTSPETVHAWWDMGRCYELQDNFAKAKEQYEKVVKAGSDTDWGKLARFRLDTLAQGPVARKPVAPPTAAAPMTPPMTPPTTLAPAAPATPSATVPAPAKPSDVK